MAPHRLRDACISARILPRQPWSPLHGLDCTFSEPALTPPEAVCTSSHGLSAWRYPHRSDPDSLSSDSPSTVREDTVSADCVLAHGAILTGAHSWMLLTVPGQLALIFSAWRRLTHEPLGAWRSERMWARSRYPIGVRRLAPGGHGADFSYPQGLRLIVHGRPWVRGWGPRRASGRGPVAAAEIPLCDAAMVAGLPTALGAVPALPPHACLLMEPGFYNTVSRTARVRRCASCGERMAPRCVREGRRKGTYRRRISESVRCCIAARC